MHTRTLLFYVGLCLAVFLGLKIYTEYADEFQLKCVVASADGNRYCVRERSKVEAAANLLAEVTNNMKRMVDYLHHTYPDDPRTQRLVAQFNPKRVNETLPTSEYTAYSENKGEKLAFCLNKEAKEGTGKMIDLQTLTFVALHELSHIMTETVGHQQVFWENFKWTLENAKAAGIYEPVDYKQAPREYCGMKINDNPYYDLK
jgi:hypothetical protein